MMDLNELRKRRELLSVIDWDMTPEDAVMLYLEWGNNPAAGRRKIISKNDVSLYFVVNTWENPPKIYLIRRNSDEAVEMAKLDMPETLQETFLHSVSHLRGVFPVTEPVRKWLESELYPSEENRAA